MRRILLQRHLAALVCAAALLLKLLVPSGYMVTNVHGLPAVTICPGAGPAPAAMIMPGMHGANAAHGAATEHGDTRDHGKADRADAPCAYVGLSAAALGAIDPVLLTGLLAFIAALAFRHVRPSALLDPCHLRPPSRGPPVRS